MLTRKDVSVLKLSKEIGIPQTTLNSQVNGRSTMSVDTFEAIANHFPDISAEWLLRGEGEMLRATITNTFQTNYGDRAVQVGGSNHGHISTGDSSTELESLRQQLAEAREEIKKKDECIYKLINAKL